MVVVAAECTAHQCWYARYAVGKVIQITDVVSLVIGAVMNTCMGNAGDTGLTKEKFCTLSWLLRYMRGAGALDGCLLNGWWG